MLFYLVIYVLTELINELSYFKSWKEVIVIFKSKGQNNEEIMNMNRSLIVQYLQRTPVCTRAQLSKELGLTPASISKITSVLLEHGVIEETGFVIGERGRRSVGIRLNTSSNRIIGVKLSRRSFSVGVFDFTGQLFSVKSETFDENEDLYNTINNIKKSISEYLDKFSDVVAIGIAVPGPYLENSGQILLITEMNNWKSINISKEFSSTFDIPVIVRHDANSGALAEWWFGSQMKQPKGSLIHFLVGEGVGAGVIVNGNIISGDHGIAGEIGHISVDINGKKCDCGNYGCLEGYCSSIAFVKHARQELTNHPESQLNHYSTLNSAMIFQAAYQNDKFAFELVKRAGSYIGYGVVNLINAYDPSTIVISNEMAGGGEMILNEVISVVNERIHESIAKDISIELSMFPDDPILYGAAAVAIDYCLKNPDILLKKVQD